MLGKKCQQYCHGQQKSLLIHELCLLLMPVFLQLIPQPLQAHREREITVKQQTTFTFTLFRLVHIIARQKQNGEGFSLRSPSKWNMPHSRYSSGHIPMSHSSLRALAPSSTAWRQSSPQEALRDAEKKHLQRWMEIHHADTKNTADSRHVTTRGHQEEMQKAAIRCYLAITNQDRHTNRAAPALFHTARQEKHQLQLCYPG